MSSENGIRMDCNFIEERLAANRKEIDLVRQAVRHARNHPFDLPPMKMRIEPGLVRVGERVRGLLEWQGSRPEGTITQEADYLGAAPGPITAMMPT